MYSYYTEGSYMNNRPTWFSVLDWVKVVLPVKVKLRPPNLYENLQNVYKYFKTI